MRAGSRILRTVEESSLWNDIDSGRFAETNQIGKWDICIFSSPYSHSLACNEILTRPVCQPLKLHSRLSQRAYQMYYYLVLIWTIFSAACSRLPGGQIVDPRDRNGEQRDCIWESYTPLSPQLRASIYWCRLCLLSTYTAKSGRWAVNEHAWICTLESHNVLVLMIKMQIILNPTTAVSHLWLFWIHGFAICMSTLSHSIYYF